MTSAACSAKSVTVRTNDLDLVQIFCVHRLEIALFIYNYLFQQQTLLSKALKTYQT